MAAKYQFRRRENLYKLIKQIKLWPARSGRLHGIKELEKQGNLIEIELYCGEKFQVKNSKNSRAARWLRNKMMVEACPGCKVPEWKLEKYANTSFG